MTRPSTHDILCAAIAGSLAALDADNAADAVADNGADNGADKSADAIADNGVRATCSALQAVVWREGADGGGGTCVLDVALGRTRLDQGGTAVVATTPFDIASVTKALVGATLAMIAVDEGRFSLDTPVGHFFPAFDRHGPPGARRATVLDLLNHGSGLPAWRKFYEEYPLDPTPERAATTRQEVLEAIVATARPVAPGERHEYSDLGYLLLASLLERAFERPLEELAEARIFAPLGMEHTRYVATRRGERALGGAAATERCALRGRVVQGDVHDENTNIVGGVSVHAGVFSTARDLIRFGRHMLAIDRGAPTGDAALCGAAPLVRRATLQRCWSEAARVPGGHHLGGWDTPSGARPSAGAGFARGRTVGHLGFTGTSIWLERDRGISAVLLTNRVHPTRDNDRIRALRIAFHEAAFREATLSEAPSASEDYEP